MANSWLRAKLDVYGFCGSVNSAISEQSKGAGKFHLPAPLHRDRAVPEKTESFFGRIYALWRRQQIIAMRCS